MRAAKIARIRVGNRALLLLNGVLLPTAQPNLLNRSTYLMKGVFMKLLAKILLLLLILMPGAAKAGDELSVDDASRIEWAIYNGRVNFRNFNIIDPAWQG